MDITIAVPLIIAIVSAIKTAGMSSRYAPILSICLGVGLFYFFGDNFDVVDSIFIGLIAGLSASGLYSGAKASLGTYNKKAGTRKSR